MDSTAARSDTERRPVEIHPRARRIDHLGVVVADVHEAARWWTDRLGLTLTHVADVLDGTIRLAYLDLGDTTIQLVEPLQDGAVRDWLDMHGEGLHHVCFLVEDLTRTLDALDDRGQRFTYLGGRGANVCFIDEAPCGVIVELTEPSDPAWSPGGSVPVLVTEPRRAQAS